MSSSSLKCTTLTLGRGCHLFSMKIQLICCTCLGLMFVSSSLAWLGQVHQHMVLSFWTFTSFLWLTSGSKNTWLNGSTLLNNIWQEHLIFFQGYLAHCSTYLKSFRDQKTLWNSIRTASGKVNSFLHKLSHFQTTIAAKNVMAVGEYRKGEEPWIRQLG